MRPDDTRWAKPVLGIVNTAPLDVVQEWSVALVINCREKRKGEVAQLQVQADALAAQVCTRVL